MRKLILSWILAAVAIGGCVTYQNNTPKELTPFEAVCQLVEEKFSDTCDGLDEPQLILTELVKYLGALGVHINGEDYIFVTPYALNVHEVIVHETVHYVLWELDISEGGCEGERFAREWTEIITGIPLNPEWEESYGCEQ